MSAGEKRKFYRNMQYERTSRTIAVLGASLMPPLALVLLAVGFIGLLFGHDLTTHGTTVGVLMAATPVIGAPRDFLTVMKENEDIVVREESRRVPNLKEKVAALASLIANEKGLPSYKRTFLMKEAENTSDFTVLFGYIIDRTLLAKYKAATPDWRTYMKAGSQMDFRRADLIGVYGLQNQLAVVTPRSEYKSDAVLADGKVSITLSKYGRVFPFAWETLINDDLGAFNDIADRLSVSAVRTEYYQATKLFASATGPHASLFGATIAHPIDGKAITNKFTTKPLSVDNLGSAATAMRRQVDADGEPILVEGFELVVPPALEYEMLKALNPSNVIMSGGDATAGVKATIRTSANVTADLNITGHVNPYLPIIDTSGNADKTWYLFAKLSSGAAVQMNFLRGHEAPEVCMKAPNKVSLGGGSMNPLEGSFENDAIAWRIRHILGGTQVDPRYAVANIG